MEEIDLEYFKKIDLRVASVVNAQKVEGTDKLLKLDVSLGDETRTIVAGIAHQYSPEELIGKKIILIKNLKPAKIRGIISEGMLLAASNEKGEISVLTLLRDIEPGSKIS
jgi:methionyl-tRNA synthetase